jgi:hypothetical protein
LCIFSFLPHMLHCPAHLTERDRTIAITSGAHKPEMCVCGGGGSSNYLPSLHSNSKGCHYRRPEHRPGSPSHDLSQPDVCNNRSVQIIISSKI